MTTWKENCAYANRLFVRKQQWQHNELTISLLNHVVREFCEVRDDFMRIHHLTEKSFHALLAAIHHRDVGGFKRSFMPAILVADTAAVAEMLSSLYDRGLVASARDPNEADRRKQVVKITKEGEQLLKKLRPVYFRFVSQLLGCYSETEKLQLIALIRKLSENITNVRKSLAAEYPSKKREPRIRPTEDEYQEILEKFKAPKLKKSKKR
jgi:DNA-binding MarR family transcriptional regulator